LLPEKTRFSNKVMFCADSLAGLCYALTPCLALYLHK